MKIIKNNVCYVESDDIRLISNLPSSIIDEMCISMLYCPNLRFFKFVNPDSVDYINGKNYIVDYDDIKDLTKSELDLLISSKKFLLADYISSCSKLKEHKLNIPEYEQKSNIKELKYLISSLEKYSQKKALYDTEINLLSFKGKQNKVIIR